VFCDQRTITGAAGRPDPRSIPGTIRRFLASQTARGPAEVAFFGGTFTALPRGDQQAYLDQVGPFIRSGAVSGIRISTRPDAVSSDILAMLKQRNVTTVELGVQSLDDTVLRLSGRGHTSDDSVRAAELLKREGFSVGMQLMPGLPGDTAERFRETVRRTISLRPDLVRLYPALVIRDTPLEQLYREDRYAPLTLETAVTLCAGALKRFSSEGIAVVRVGLQSTAELERTGAVVAGPYHPAFRQLVESALYLEKMLPLAAGVPAVTFRVHPADLSPAIGHQRRNIATLQEQCGIPVTVLPDPGVPRGMVTVKPPCTRHGDGL
jgi:histone acetyltransferase (RNA polymerase elongator complex component)